jgi:hypothetical protein
MPLSVFGEYYSFIGRAFRVRYTVCPGIEFTYKREKKIFLILRKNFRGITLFASFETPIFLIKKMIQCSDSLIDII